MMKAGLIRSNLLHFFIENLMSKQALERVVGKIVLDASFRDALIAAPDEALSGFDLNEGEKAWLKHIDLETMEAMAHTLALCTRKVRLASQIHIINGEDRS